MNLVETVRRRLEQLRIPMTHHVLIGVSGGADSVALAVILSDLLREGGGRCTLAHLHHGIRGREASADANSVRRLARRLGAGCTVGHADVPALAKRKKISTEMAAREARRSFLVRAAKRCGTDCVALAHHADDQAETVLLRLARGAGLQGLAAIRPLSDWQGCPIIRPLLSVRRSEIETFLQELGIRWRDDRTNLDESISRNRIRHRILPYLERQLNPDLRMTLCRTAEILSAEDEWMEERAVRAHRSCRLGVGPGELRLRPLQSMAPALMRRVLVRWLFDGGLSSESVDFETVERIRGLLEPDSDAIRTTVAGGLSVEKKNGKLLLAGFVKPVAWKPVNWKLPGVAEIPELGLRFSARAARGFIRRPETGFGCWPAEAWIVRLKPNETLRIRAWKAGDRFEPFGSGGRRKIQDVFTDAKLSRDSRLSIPIVTDDRGIVWLPGFRICRGRKVAGPATDSWHLWLEKI